jgi:hypothetical protein
MMRLNKSRAREPMTAVSLAATLALLVAVVLSSGAEAQRGGGGAGKPSAPSKASSASGSSASKAGD